MSTPTSQQFTAALDQAVALLFPQDGKHSRPSPEQQKLLTFLTHLASSSPPSKRRGGRTRAPSPITMSITFAGLHLALSTPHELSITPLTPASASPPTGDTAQTLTIPARAALAALSAAAGTDVVALLKPARRTPRTATSRRKHSAVHSRRESADTAKSNVTVVTEETAVVETTTGEVQAQAGGTAKKGEAKKAGWWGATVGKVWPLRWNAPEITLEKFTRRRVLVHGKVWTF
ncbi:hypothetical protein EDC01DRAFT_776065 [Geopyxis carbonaria]|nr:hypothetical protein EDC01DRAFT_776065 [Geopyxis carbonaria]